MKKWTHNDEMVLVELAERKRVFFETQKEPLTKAVDRLLYNYDADADSITRALIEHADLFRDLLEPFDSGVRQG